METKVIQVKDLYHEKIDGKYRIRVGDFYLKTPAGLIIETPSPALWDRIREDLEGEGDILIDGGVLIKPRVFSAYVLISTQLDFVEQGLNFAADFQEWIPNDPLFMPEAGHPTIAIFQNTQHQPVDEYLAQFGLRLNAWQRYNPKQQEHLIDILATEANNLSPAQKSALINLAWPIGGHFVATILFLLGRCNAKEWASLVFSRTGDVCRLIGEEPSGEFFSLSDNLNEDEREELIKAIIEDYEMNARIAEKYFEVG